MPRGGPRPNGGRPKNKRSKEFIEKAEASGLMPLEFMLQVMRNLEAPLADRFKAAAEAAPYMHPKLVASHATDAKDREFLSWVDERSSSLQGFSSSPQCFILTTILGVVGAVVATFLGQALGW
jgi:hypothetical protein